MYENDDEDTDEDNDDDSDEDGDDDDDNVDDASTYYERHGKFRMGDEVDEESDSDHELDEPCRICFADIDPGYRHVTEERSLGYRNKPYC